MLNCHADIQTFVTRTMLQRSESNVIRLLKNCYSLRNLENTRYCSLTKMSEPKWLTEKYRLLNMTTTDRNKADMADNKVFTTVDMVDPWNNYVIRNKHLEKERIHNLDDLTEFKKIKIDSEQNKELAQRVSIYKGDITQLQVCISD